LASAHTLLGMRCAHSNAVRTPRGGRALHAVRTSRVRARRVAMMGYANNDQVID
jgi:hypothetical protein